VDLQFVDRVIKSTLVLVALLFPFFALYFSMNFALAVLFGALWGCLNLLAIRFIVVSLLTPDKKNLALGLTILFVKLPVLYGIGYLLIAWNYPPIGGLLWGFSGILIVMVLKVLGRMYLGLDNKVKANETNV
jgi:hypothetical protein